MPRRTLIATAASSLLAAAILLGAGCATPGSQDMAATRAAWGSGSAGAMAARIRDDKPLRMGAVTVPAPVAYEWLAAGFMREGHPDDAVLAVCMSALLSIESKDVPDSSLPLALFEFARELRSSQALQASLADRAAGAEQKPLNLQDLVAAIGQASEKPLRSSDPAFEQRVTQAWRERLTPKPPTDPKKTTPKYVEGDAAFISAFALSLFQREEDLPYIEYLLASDSIFPVLQPYLRAIVKKNPALADKLLAHPSAAVRANALVALKRPAPANETHPLALVAGALTPQDGGEEAALRLLETSLTNNVHMVRVLAMVGLTAKRQPIPSAIIEEAIRTSDDWRAQHVLLFGEGAGNTINLLLAGGKQTNNYEDGQLPRYGYTLFAAPAERSEDDVRWLIGQLRPDPPLLRKIGWMKDMDGPDGYVQETSENQTADRLNSILADGLSKHAVAHPEPVLEALGSANPYTRLFLIASLAPAAGSNDAVRAALWKIAEPGSSRPSAEDAAYTKALQDRIVAKVQSTLSYNQYVNRGAVDSAVNTVLDRLRIQCRRSALAALAGTETDQDRMAALLRDPEVARTLVPYFLKGGAEAVERHAPASLLDHRSSEVRLAAALLRLSAADEPAARKALASTLNDPDASEFAARFALASRNKAVSDVVMGARKVQALSVTGHLIRRLEIRGAAPVAAAPAAAAEPKAATAQPAAQPKAAPAAPAAKPKAKPAATAPAAQRAAPAADQPVGR